LDYRASSQAWLRYRRQGAFHGWPSGRSAHHLGRPDLYQTVRTTAAVDFGEGFGEVVG
jgi:hypothetical protein